MWGHRAGISKGVAPALRQPGLDLGEKLTDGVRAERRFLDMPSAALQRSSLD
jgi:hypothetical protein